MIRWFKSNCSNQIIDERVNNFIRNISLCGGKIVSITTERFGLSPMNMFFIIIYESEKGITNKELDRKEGIDNE